MTSSLLGIIPAAGSGVRARPYTYEQHKGMFLIDGRPNLERIISTMRDDLDIDEIVMVLGYMGDSLRNHFGDGSDHGVRIHYVENQNLDKGWAWSVLLAKPFLADRYGFVMLADEFYLDANLVDFRHVDLSELSAVCAVKQTDDPSLIRKNYSVVTNGDVVTRMVENPVSVPSNLLGIGTFVVAPEVLTLLEQAYEGGRQAVEFVNFVDELIRDGHRVAAFEITGEYINLNDVASLEAAQDLAIRHRLGK